MTSCPFPRGKNRNRSPDFPNGFADGTFGGQGLAELPRGAVVRHSEVTGLSQTLVVYCHPKGTYNRLCVPLGGDNRDSASCAISHPKGDCGRHSSPSRSSLEGHRCLVPSPRHLTLTGTDSPQLHCSGLFQGHDPITPQTLLPRVPRADTQMDAWTTASPLHQESKSAPSCEIIQEEA